MSKCKHQTGKFFECIKAYHQRNVIDGIVDKDSFNNEYGNGICHYYECDLCGNKWKWVLKPRQKWLNILFENAYSCD